MGDRLAHAVGEIDRDGGGAGNSGRHFEKDGLRQQRQVMVEQPPAVADVVVQHDHAVEVVVDEVLKHRLRLRRIVAELAYDHAPVPLPQLDFERELQIVEELADLRVDQNADQVAAAVAAQNARLQVRAVVMFRRNPQDALARLGADPGVAAAVRIQDGRNRLLPDIGQPRNLPLTDSFLHDPFCFFCEPYVEFPILYQNYSEMSIAL